jgi:hypothetical protein
VGFSDFGLILKEEWLRQIIVFQVKPVTVNAFTSSASNKIENIIIHPNI